MNVIEEHESEVRSYCRSWPTTFDRAVGSVMWNTDGERYIDFFAGAGALNYGHNDPDLKKALMDYLAGDGVVHSLDMFTKAKADFLRTFDEVVLTPRGLDYKVQFPGPTGTNAVEAALKLARKVKGREQIVSFTNAFHGMTLGSLAVTGNSMKRGGAGIPLAHTTPMPFCNYMEEGSGLTYFESLLADSGSGLDLPAAVIVETVQGEGGINVASYEWLRRLSELCRDNDILLIIDDIQMGCGRTGPFFSFEPAGITPDIVTLSKSISGYGFPMALTLLRPELDVWEPGEHNGTFRGHNPAFITGAAGLRKYWSDDVLTTEVEAKTKLIEGAMLSIVSTTPGTDTRGRGFAQGLVFEDPDKASAVVKACFERHLLLETSGPESEVVKAMPALTITEAELNEGLDILAASVAEVMGTGADVDVPTDEAVTS
ncbi:diaminobutyrate--2-oxoglutarate transaminase [Rhabdothermincola salaria]|uniref:diaminobutyrate--2-oxoglutarate transaminase n=1 Tax=Rhabdothermincola salaria TaxID=2903142 RepID=UPI001E2E63F2|nr:diaminobutyrate--2-oxoglutarate transaminase [Rhabdothermincola salaria]MCD9624711.1 diaminobutyrate--2-oxoglutarate transaminase [Rhabdothermincola salaria]